MKSRWTLAGSIVAVLVLALAGTMGKWALAQVGGPGPSSADRDSVSPGSALAEEEAPTDAAPSLPMSSAVDGLPHPVPITAGAEADLAPNDVVPQYNAHWRVVGSALKPRASNVTYVASSSGGCVYVTGGEATVVWNTPVWLPPGSEVEYLRMYVVDSNASVDTCGWFTRYDLYGGISKEWSVCSSGSSGQGYFTTLISPTETIDYSNYSYVLNWRPMGTGDTIQLCGFRLYYTAPPFYGAFLPSVMKNAGP